MAEIQVNVKCLGDMCKGCTYMQIATDGVLLLSDGIRGLPTFDPHCKHMFICKNAIELRAKNDEQKADE